VIVTDASVLANAVGDDYANGATARGELRKAQEVAVPDLVNVEAAAVLRKRWIAGDLSAGRLDKAMDALVSLPLHRYPTIGLLRRAMELRDNVTPHDGVYVALAEALGVELLTSDEKLAAAPGPRCVIRVIAHGQRAVAGVSLRPGTARTAGALGSDRRRPVAPSG
jgi:predicted nucleic acid-binding protein